MSVPTNELFKKRVVSRPTFCFASRAKTRVTSSFRSPPLVGAANASVIAAQHPESREIKALLEMWGKLQKKRPEKVATERATALCNDTCQSHFRDILKGRMKQSSLSETFLDEVRKAWLKGQTQFILFPWTSSKVVWSPRRMLYIILNSLSLLQFIRLYSCCFLYNIRYFSYQKHVTKYCVFFVFCFFGGRRINGISFHFRGENWFDIRGIWVTSSITERNKLASQGPAVFICGMKCLLFPGPGIPKPVSDMLPHVLVSGPHFSLI